MMSGRRGRHDGFVTFNDVVADQGDGEGEPRVERAGTGKKPINIVDGRLVVDKNMVDA